MPGQRPSRRTILSLPFLGLLSGCNGGGSQPAVATDQPPRGGRSPEGSPGPEAATRPEKLRVGLLTAGSLADSGWNSLAGDGLKRIESELGVDTSHQSSTAAQAEEALRGFARDGFTLVFAHGTEFGDAAESVAQEYPKVRFVVSSGESAAENVASLHFAFGEATYLAGMAAAALSQSGMGGQIGGQDFPAVADGFRWFERGGQAARPGFKTSITYLGNWSDANAAKEKALAMIRNGADVLFQNCDAAGAGVIQAAKEAGDGKVVLIGSNADQNHLAPEYFAASAVIDVARTFARIAKEASEGRFAGKIHHENLAGGTVYLAISNRFRDRIGEKTLALIQQAEEDIKSGKLQIAASPKSA